MFRSFTDVLRSPARDEAVVDALWEEASALGTPIRVDPGPAPDSARDERSVPVVIGIDEVDKIEDPRTAQAFFNQIKGLFGDTRCLFLISISDDAMAAYERRGLPLRDAFDSSLATVITLPYLTRQAARTLTGSRLVRITEPSADLLYVLSGGLPRELVRLIRRAVDFQRVCSDGTSAGAEGTADEGVGHLLAPVPLHALASAVTVEQVAA